jgi:hypothetical protein
MVIVNTMKIWKPIEVSRAEEDDFSVSRSPSRSFRSAAPPEKGINHRISKVQLV